MKKICFLILIFVISLAFVSCNTQEEVCRHEFSREYVCTKCGEATTCTLDILGQEYKEEILALAQKNAGEVGEGATQNFEIVVLDKEKTIENLQFYTMNPVVDNSLVEKGLFVKYDLMVGQQTVFTAYYNFGLEFNRELAEDISVTTEGTSESWFLEVVEGNKKIAFEYSVAE